MDAKTFEGDLDEPSTFEDFDVRRKRQYPPSTVFAGFDSFD